MEQKILSIIADLYREYKKLSRFLLYLYSFLFLAAGYIIIGPFLLSDFYKWINEQSNNNSIVKELTDVGDMMMNSLISASFPMFLAFSISFFTYLYLRENKRVVEVVANICSSFVKGPAKLLLYLFFAISGISLYALKHCDTISAFGIFVISAIYFLSPAAFMLYFSKIEFKENNKLAALIPYMGILTGFLALSTYLYSTFGEMLLTGLKLWQLYKGS